MSTYEELERLRRAVARLAETHQEALEVTEQALEVGWNLETGEVDLEDDVELRKESEHLAVALQEVQAILEGAAVDVQAMLEDGNDP